MAGEAADWLGRQVEVVVEVPCGSFVKRGADGRIDVLSPLPVPWNYGSVPGVTGGDGDPLDAIVLGRRRARGWRGTVEVIGVVEFVDGGAEDWKLVCGGPVPLLRARVAVFFGLYVPLKRALHAMRGRPGWTGVRAVRWADYASRNR